MSSLVEKSRKLHEPRCRDLAFAADRLGMKEAEHACRLDEDHQAPWRRHTHSLIDERRPISYLSRISRVHRHDVARSTHPRDQRPKMHDVEMPVGVWQALRGVLSGELTIVGYVVLVLNWGEIDALAGEPAPAVRPNRVHYHENLPGLAREETLGQSRPP